MPVLPWNRRRAATAEPPGVPTSPASTVSTPMGAAASDADGRPELAVRVASIYAPGARAVNVHSDGARSTRPARGPVSGADRPTRLAVLDRCPVVRAGIATILAGRPDLAPAGAAPDEQALWPLLYRARPDVVLVEHRPEDGAGLATCLRITARPFGPRVIVWASNSGPDTIAAAAVAGVGAIVDKAAGERDVLQAVRAVGRGERLLAPLTPALQSAAARRLDAVDRAIFAMRLAGTRPRDIAGVVGLDPRALEARTVAIVTALGTRSCCAGRALDPLPAGALATDWAA
jgi:DNA-binding NarL/FixJ family response regulator